MAGKLSDGSHRFQLLVFMSLYIAPPSECVEICDLLLSNRILPRWWDVTVIFILLTDFLCCLLGLYALMNQTALLEKHLWICGQPLANSQLGTRNSVKQCKESRLLTTMGAWKSNHALRQDPSPGQLLHCSLVTDPEAKNPAPAGKLWDDKCRCL